MGGITLLYHQNRITKVEFVAVMVLFTALAYWQLDFFITITGVMTSAAILLTRVENKLFALIVGQAQMRTVLEPQLIVRQSS